MSQSLRDNQTPILVYHRAQYEGSRKIVPVLGAFTGSPGICFQLLNHNLRAEEQAPLLSALFSDANRTFRAIFAP
jgi:hypothetical protein